MQVETVLQLLLIVLAVWTVLALLVLPVLMRLGRAAHVADVDVAREHEALVEAARRPAPRRESLRAS